MKKGNLVEWSVNGYLLVTVDTTNFASPTMGGNISFGQFDINFASSTDPVRSELIFTLIDNIAVTVPEPSAFVLLVMGACVLLKRSH
jgi:hypothetical protein